MSDTPRTDAAIHTIPELPYEDVDANFARQLERELAASRDSEAALASEVDRLGVELSASRKENERILCDWGVAKRELKASRTEVERLRDDVKKMEAEIKQLIKELNEQGEYIHSKIVKASGLCDVDDGDYRPEKIK